MNAATLWVVIAPVSGALAVLLGAFGAHALRARLPAERLASWNIAVEYHLVHSAVLLALALFGLATSRSVSLPAGLVLAGIVLFSGSIYGLVLTEQRWLGPVTPLGGVCLIAGWLSLLTLLRSGQ